MLPHDDEGAPEKTLEKCSTIIIDVLEQPRVKGTAKAFHTMYMELGVLEEPHSGFLSPLPASNQVPRSLLI